MKYAAVIFAFFIVLLSAAPAAEHIYSALSHHEKCHSHCCMAAHEKIPAKKNNSCNNMNGCNPLQGCCCCSCAVPTCCSADIILKTTLIFHVEIFSAFLSTYSSSCWQPPEMA
ncbi:MAG: hypothetical protein HY064_11000 [Bacteroidetes bacterium]|nr:hypothetical protein [Bacteroidota bacterium]